MLARTRMRANLLAPFVLEVQRQRVGEVFLEQLRRLFRRVQEVQALFLRGAQVHAESLDLVHDLAAGERRSLQQKEEHPH